MRRFSPSATWCRGGSSPRTTGAPPRGRRHARTPRRCARTRSRSSAACRYGPTSSARRWPGGATTVPRCPSSQAGSGYSDSRSAGRSPNRCSRRIHSPGCVDLRAPGRGCSCRSTTSGCSSTPPSGCWRRPSRRSMGRCGRRGSCTEPRSSDSRCDSRLTLVRDAVSWPHSSSLTSTRECSRSSVVSRLSRSVHQDRSSASAHARGVDGKALARVRGDVACTGVDCHAIRPVAVLRTG